ncbi:BTB/POZ domain-containing protein 2 isoform X3 [Camelus ferus]|uniref:BTB/POZ domain-containing protein 2 isoform X3 n=1 Tax=Camelus ferus TaxID=419612 RepID=A0A8B8RVF4_CAMFR|nr:BTB/POZ domain-containing protein 2 isoform X3 [Camelus ferus]
MAAGGSGGRASCPPGVGPGAGGGPGPSANAAPAPGNAAAAAAPAPAAPGPPPQVSGPGAQAAAGGERAAEEPGAAALLREPVYNWQATKPTVKERFAFLFNNEVLCDVHFLVGKGLGAQRIPAHRFVLAVGSAVFDAMFNGGMATTSTEIELPDVEPAAFLALLNPWQPGAPSPCLGTGLFRTPHIRGLTLCVLLCLLLSLSTVLSGSGPVGARGGPSVFILCGQWSFGRSNLMFLYSDEVQIGPETVMTTLYTAKKYAVPALEAHCVEFLKKNLRADNAFMLLTQARLFDEPQLASLCLENIDKNTADAISAEGFTDIDLDTLVAVLERDTLGIREVRLFNAVVRWSEAECQRQQLQVTPENKRKVLGKALALIRFPLMTIEEFAAALLAPPEPLSSQSLSPPGHQSPLGSQAPVTPPPPPGVPSPHPWPSHHASRGPPRPNSHQPPPACRRLGCVCLSFGMSWACGLVPLRRCPRGFSCHSVCPRGFSCLFCLT